MLWLLLLGGRSHRLLSGLQRHKQARVAGRLLLHKERLQLLGGDDDFLRLLVLPSWLLWDRRCHQVLRKLPGVGVPALTARCCTPGRGRGAAAVRTRSRLRASGKHAPTACSSGGHRRTGCAQGLLWLPQLFRHLHRRRATAPAPDSAAAATAVRVVHDRRPSGRARCLHGNHGATP